MYKKMFSRTLGIVFGLCGLLANAATHDVDIVGFAFSPATITINQGDTVRWTERDGAFHTATSDTGVFNSGNLQFGQSYSFTFNTPGSYGYFCQPHPGMRGTVVVQASANPPPTATITNPVNNAVFTSPASVSIGAEATDSNGTVANVQFYNGNSFLGTDSSRPYSVTATLAIGSHSLRAVATDNQGARGTSAVVTVTVQAPQNVSPTVTITNPLNNTVYSGPTNVLIAADPRDSDGTVTMVEFYDGGSFLGMAHNAPWTFNAGFASGNHSLTAVALDNSGGRGTSSVVNITVQSPPNSAPSISITNPANGTIFSGATNLLIQAAASDTDGTVVMAEFYDGGTFLGMSHTQPWEFRANLGVGTHNLAAVALDNGGTRGTSAVVTVTVQAPMNRPPSISITNPLNNTVYSGPTNVLIEVEAIDPDGTVVMVEFYNGTTYLEMTHSSPFNYTASLGAGTHTLTAVGTDNGGAMATSAVVTVTVQSPPNGAPVVSINSPTNNTFYPAATNILIEAEASDADGSIAHVEFFQGTNGLGRDSSHPYTAMANIAVGSHIFLAVATDNTGNSTTSAVINVRVASNPITNPIPNLIAKGDITVELQTIADGLASPLGMADPNDGRKFIYDQEGRVWIINSQGRRLQTPLLDIRSRLVTLSIFDERGLLGFVLHPGFATNKLLYTYTSEPVNGTADFTVPLPDDVDFNHQSVIAEWRMDDANTNQVNLASRREIMRIDQPQGNHNGGTMQFGPDGMLYIALGDGGAGDDQGNGHVEGGNGQSLQTVLGKFLRIDVNGRSSANGQYAVPSSNPFVNTNGIDEIFAYGLRNPYTFSFDRQEGTLYVADVGQNRLEEINILLSGGNYGWNVKEGTFFFDPNGALPGYVTDTPVRPVPEGLIDPIAQYDHDDGLAVVGGSVYRGQSIPALSGRYVFGDWGLFNEPRGRLFYLETNSEIKELRIGLDDRALGHWLKGFGEDASGEIYAFISKALGPYGTSGRVIKLVAAGSPVGNADVMLANTNVHLNWEGGIGPFAVQKKTALDETLWMNRVVTNAMMALEPTLGDMGFFRISDTANQLPIPMTAWLIGQNERPTPVNSPGGGSGILVLDGSSLKFEVAYTNLSAPATAAHIHGPSTAESGTNVLIDLAPFNGGAFGNTNGTLSGTVILTPAQKAIILSGKSYINVHTTNNPAGEIRGQIAPVLFQATMNGPKERPTPVHNTRGGGSALFTLVANQLTFNIIYSNLTGVASMAHIHGPADESGRTGILIDFAQFNGGAYGQSGVVSGTIPLTANQLAALVDGLTYVNFHTAANTGGEIRGQITPHSTAVPFTVLMSGANERPNPVQTTATGSAILALEHDTLSFNADFRGLSAPSTGGHIHGPVSAAASTNILIDLLPFKNGPLGDTSGFYSGSVKVNQAQIGYLLRGLTYVNVHSTNFRGGEIRGQVAPVLLRADLSGSTERPASVRTLGSGSGLFALVWDQLDFNISYNGLTSVANAAHIHGPATTGQATNVLINLAPFVGGSFGTSGSIFGRTTLSPTHFSYLIDGLTYVNIPTPTNAPGEIRGQINK